MARDSRNNIRTPQDAIRVQFYFYCDHDKHYRAMKRIDLSENEYLQKNSATSSALPFSVIPFSVLDILN